MLRTLCAVLGTLVVAAACAPSPTQITSPMPTTTVPDTAVVTLAASRAGEPPPFRDGAQQEYKLIDAEGQTVSQGPLGHDPVRLELEPGTFLIVSSLRADGSRVMDGDLEPITPGGRKPMTGTLVAGRRGAYIATCTAVVEVGRLPVSVMVEAGLQGCRILTT